MNLLLPKSHLSWSALSLWKQSKERFIRQYFANGDSLDTKYLQFGKNIATSIEDGSYIGTLPHLTVYEIPEYEVEVSVNGVPLLSYIDSYDPVNHIFREYKTGKIPWTQSKVQKHGQLLFYAVALRALTGIAPTHCHLDWIETREVESDGIWDTNEKKVELTGKILTFYREFDTREVDNMEEDIIRTAHEISEAYKQFISNL